MNSRRREIMGDSEINIDLWPAGVWTSNELKDFRNLVEEFGSTSGQLSSDIRGIDTQTVIAFAMGAIAAGFFEKLGSELYAHLKSGLKRLLLKRRDYIDEVNGRLSFSYEEDGMGLYAFYTCRYSSEKELDVLFSSLHTFNSSVISACDKSLFPFDTGQQYEFHASLEFDESPKWDIRIRRYSMEGKTLVFNEIFDADLEISKLKETKWEMIDWKHLPGLLDF